MHAVTLNPTSFALAPSQSVTVVATVGGVPDEPDDITIIGAVNVIVQGQTQTANFAATIDYPADPQPVATVTQTPDGLLTVSVASAVQDAADPSTWTIDILVTAN